MDNAAIDLPEATLISDVSPKRWRLRLACSSHHAPFHSVSPPTIYRAARK
jgi:hypothetical protein